MSYSVIPWKGSHKCHMICSCLVGLPWDVLILHDKAAFQQWMCAYSDPSTSTVSPQILNEFIIVLNYPTPQGSTKQYGCISCISQTICHTPSQKLNETGRCYKTVGVGGLVFWRWVSQFGPLWWGHALRKWGMGLRKRKKGENWDGTWSTVLLLVQYCRMCQWSLLFSIQHLFVIYWKTVVIRWLGAWSVETITVRVQSCY